MFRRIIKSLINQIDRSMLLILFMCILSLSLSVSFLIRQGGVNVNSEFLDTINPEAVVTGELSYKSTSDFAGLYIKGNSLENNNAYVRDFYNDMISMFITGYFDRYVQSFLTGVSGQN